MCMKNVNITLAFAEILANKSETTFSLLDIGKSFPITYDEDASRRIEKITMAVFINAVETKNKKSLADVNPREKMIFDKKYDFIIRLTESLSGEFIDLGKFSIYPKENIIDSAQCCDIFRQTRFCVFEDKLLPPKKEKEFFVIKLLIKPSDDTTNKWIVQTVCPITFSK